METDSATDTPARRLPMHDRPYEMLRISYSRRPYSTARLWRAEIRSY